MSAASALFRHLDAALDRIFMPSKPVEVIATDKQVRMVQQRRAFDGLEAAERWCSDRGISAGPIEDGKPRGLMRGNHEVPAWDALTPEQIARLDGVMRAHRGWLKGPVVVSVITAGDLPR